MDPLIFGYGADGQRIWKRSTNTGNTTYYIRDAQGNVMAIYNSLPSDARFDLIERPIYGSDRLGLNKKKVELYGKTDLTLITPESTNDGDIRYELKDHLGNVAVVTTGDSYGVDTDGDSNIDFFVPKVLEWRGYEPFGALLPGRNHEHQFAPPPPPPTDPKGTLVITEFSNGPAGDCEYVELYITRCSLYPDATTVDIRGWIVDDNAGNFNTSGGCSTGVGINSGHLRFADVATWAGVPVGRVIVLYNGGDNCYNFTPNESGAGGKYIVNVNSTSLIERTGTNGTPDVGDCDYCGNSYTATDNSPSSWGSTIALRNSADAIQVRCPDCPADEAGYYHGVAYGSGFGALSPGANDVGGAYVSGPGTGRSYVLTGTACGTLGSGSGWTRTNAPSAGTPPATAGVVDAAVLGMMSWATWSMTRASRSRTSNGRWPER